MIDPNILLQSRPPVIQTALDAQQQARQNQNLANVGELQRGDIALQPGRMVRQKLENQNLANVGDLQQGDISEQAMKIQAQRKAMADDQIWAQSNIDGKGDPDKVASLASERGVSPQSVMKYKQGSADYIGKLASNKKEDLEAHGLQTAQLYDLWAPIADIKDPIQQSAAWTDAQARAKKLGLLDDEEIAKHPYPGPQGVPQYAAQFSNERALTTKALLQRAQTDAKKEEDFRLNLLNLGTNRDKRTDILDRNATTNENKAATGGLNADGTPKPLTEAQKATQSRFDEKEKVNLRNALDVMHQTRAAYGGALSVEDGAAFVDPKTGRISKDQMTPGLHSVYQEIYDNATNAARRIQTQLGVHEVPEDGQQPAAPAAAKPPAAAQKPQAQASTPKADDNEVISVKVKGGRIVGTRAQVKAALAAKGLSLQE